MKIAINSCYGGFSLSPKACLYLYKNKAKSLKMYTTTEWYGSPRTKQAASNLKIWRAYLKNPKEYKDRYLTVFTPNFRKVIDPRDIDGTDPVLIKYVEKLKEKANGSCAKLKVIEIPDGVNYTITEYDGLEQVEEIHQIWS